MRATGSWRTSCSTRRTRFTGSALWGTGSYAYDAMGNLMSRSLGVPPVDDGTVLSVPGRHLRATTAVTGQVDRLGFTFLGTTPKISFVTSNGLDHTVMYDSAGNETGYLATRTYSPRNLMSAVTDISSEGPAHQLAYGYDYRGVRVSRTETPTDAGSASRYFFYTPELQLLASTVDDSGNAWGQTTHHIMTSPPLAMNREIIWFNGQPVAEYGPPRTPDDTTTIFSRHLALDTGTATNTFYTFTDHLGTPLIQMDPTTAIVWRAEYEPYGNVYLIRKGARTDQPLRFPGQAVAMSWEGMEENYNVFRWYRAAWGRYTQPDPLGLGGINVFNYVAANPTGRSDALGLVCGSGITEAIVPDKLYGVFDLTHPCQNHDNCYSTCGAKKAQCDLGLLHDIQNLPICKQHPFLQPVCNLIAHAYYDGVSDGGYIPFKKAQEQACKGCCYQHNQPVDPPSPLLSNTKYWKSGPK